MCALSSSSDNFKPIQDEYIYKFCISIFIYKYQYKRDYVLYWIAPLFIMGTLLWLATDKTHGKDGRREREKRRCSGSAENCQHVFKISVTYVGNNHLAILGFNYIIYKLNFPFIFRRYRMVFHLLYV